MNNKSGITGIYWDSTNDRWRYIKDGKTLSSSKEKLNVIKDLMLYNNLDDLFDYWGNSYFLEDGEFIINEVIKKRDYNELEYKMFIKNQNRFIEDYKNIPEDIFKEIDKGLEEDITDAEYELIDDITCPKYNKFHLTIVVSDLHIGDRSFMRDTCKSVFRNIIDYVNYNKNLIKSITVLFNGDTIPGIGVYKKQITQTLNANTDWQNFIAGYFLIENLLSPLSINGIDLLSAITRGNHDVSNGYDVSLGLAMYLKAYGYNVNYWGDEILINLLDPQNKENIDTSYNLFAFHGYNYAPKNPQNGKLIDNTISRLFILQRERNIRVDRVTTSHSHWLNTDMIHSGIPFDCTGGMQKNSRQSLGFNTRPMGYLGYTSLSPDEPIKFLPDEDIRQRELYHDNLYSKNMIFIGESINSIQSDQDLFKSI